MIQMLADRSAPTDGRDFETLFGSATASFREEPRLWQPRRRTPARVLVADDDRSIRLAVRTCLESEGYQVREARDGRQTVLTILEDAPQLVVLDLIMPDLSGLAVLEVLSLFNPPIRPAVVILTAHGSIWAANIAHDLGVSVFLEKPLVPQTLCAAAEHALTHAGPPLPEEIDEGWNDDPPDDV